LIPVSVQRQDDADPVEAEEVNYLRMISLVEDETVMQIQEIVCADCSRLIQWAFARTEDQSLLLQSHKGQEATLPALKETQRFDN